MTEKFEGFDPEIAALVASADLTASGLRACLGHRTVDVGEGYMTAELDVRHELLNPFGVAHGGVVSALVDHVLGAVLYPVMPRGSWAATTEFKINLLAPVRSDTLSARSGGQRCVPADRRGTNRCDLR